MYKSSLFLFSLVLVLISATPAHAYLDPGTGSMMLQLLLGGVAAVLFILKLYWRRLLRFFGLARDDFDKEETDSAAKDAS